QLARSRDDDRVDVAERLDHVLLVVRRYHDERRLLAPRGEQAHGALRRGLVEPLRIEDGKRSVAGVDAERAAQSRAPCFPIHLDLEVAIAGRESDAAAGPVRCTRRSRTRATRALLAPGLRA